MSMNAKRVAFMLLQLVVSADSLARNYRPPPGAGGALLGMMFDGEYMGGEQGGSAGARRPSGGESPAIQQRRQKTTHAADPSPTDTGDGDIVAATLAANLAKNPYQPPPRKAPGKCHTAQFGK